MRKDLQVIIVKQTHFLVKNRATLHSVFSFFFFNLKKQHHKVPLLSVQWEWHLNFKQVTPFLFLIQLLPLSEPFSSSCHGMLPFPLPWGPHTALSPMGRRRRRYCFSLCQAGRKGWRSEAAVERGDEMPLVWIPPSKDQAEDKALTFRTCHGTS